MKNAHTGACCNGGWGLTIWGRCVCWSLTPTILLSHAWLPVPVLAAGKPAPGPHGPERHKAILRRCGCSRAPLAKVLNKED